MKEINNLEVMNVQKFTYEYDFKYQALIKRHRKSSPQIIKKDNLVWRELGAEDESYARAIYLGQGCWENLKTITEEEAQDILRQWGYSFFDE